MRLNPGITLARADQALLDAETAWVNAGASGNFYRDYHDAVDKTYAPLRECFVEPDLAEHVRSAAYWHLLSIQKPDLSAPRVGGAAARMVADNTNSLVAQRAQHDAFRREIGNRQLDLAKARKELDALKVLSERPGLPLVFDTNILNHWRRPTEIDWPAVLREWGETAKDARVVIPLRVIDELDHQKYGDGPLAKRATRALRGLQEVLNGYAPGEPVPINDDGRATLEVWVSGDARDGDADLAILRCAADLDALHPGAARVVTGDLGMQLRAAHMDLAVRTLPGRYRKTQAEASAKFAGWPT